MKVHVFFIPSTSPGLSWGAIDPIFCDLIFRYEKVRFIKSIFAICLALMSVGNVFANDCNNSGIKKFCDRTGLDDAIKIVKDEFENILLKDFFSKLPPCEAKEFLDPAMTAGWGHFFGRVKRQEISSYASEVVRPTRFNKLYHNHRNRPAFRENAIKLAQELESKGRDDIGKEAIIKLAKQRFENAKARGEVGECIFVDTMGGYKYIFGERRDSIALSKESMEEIEALFGKDSESYKIPLSERESTLIDEGTFTAEEIYELRGIKKATEVFEKNTVLKDDKAGGFFSNLTGEIVGDFQQNCVTESSTYQNFLSMLKNRGYLKYFSNFSQITQTPPLSRDPTNSGHAAVKLTSLSGKSVVLDSWFEKGGSPAHLIKESDWLELSLWQTNQFEDVVIDLP